jgi:hypothetical protein
MTDWLTAAEVKLIANRHIDTVRRALESGELHGHQRTRKGRWQIHPNAVDAWIRGMDGPTACGCVRLRAVRRSA